MSASIAPGSPKPGGSGTPGGRARSAGKLPQRLQSKQKPKKKQAKVAIDDDESNMVIPLKHSALLALSPGALSQLDSQDTARTSDSLNLDDLDGDSTARTSGTIDTRRGTMDTSRTTATMDTSRTSSTMDTGRSSMGGSTSRTDGSGSSRGPNSSRGDDDGQPKQRQTRQERQEALIKKKNAANAKRTRDGKVDDETKGEEAAKREQIASEVGLEKLRKQKQAVKETPEEKLRLQRAELAGRQRGDENQKMQNRFIDQQVRLARFSKIQKMNGFFRRRILKVPVLISDLSEKTQEAVQMRGLNQTDLRTLKECYDIYDVDNSNSIDMFEVRGGWAWGVWVCGCGCPRVM
jgi:hypothetical protein